VARNAAVKVQKPACTVGIYFVGTVKRGIGDLPCRSLIDFGSVQRE
jgi:hypothetical protein